MNSRLNSNKSQYCRPQCKSYCLVCRNSISRKEICYKCKKVIRKLWEDTFQFVEVIQLLMMAVIIIYNDGCLQAYQLVLIVVQIACKDSIIFTENFIKNQDLQDQQTYLFPQNYKKTLERPAFQLKKLVCQKGKSVFQFGVIKQLWEMNHATLVFYFNDGCHQCLFNCHFGCSNFIQGQCNDYQQESINNFIKNLTLSDIQNNYYL